MHNLSWLIDEVRSERSHPPDPRQLSTTLSFKSFEVISIDCVSVHSSENVYHIEIETEDTSFHHYLDLFNKFIIQIEAALVHHYYEGTILEYERCISGANRLSTRLTFQGKFLYNREL